MTQPPPAGWYPDQSAPGSERWFDGQQWTPTTRPTGTAALTMAPPQQFVPPQAVKKRRKWPWIVLGAIVLLIIISVASNGGSKSAGTNAPSNGSTVTHNLGSQDATGDVRVGKIVVDPTLNMPSVAVTVTNHSSKRSNYIVTVALESADGKTQIDTATVSVENLEPGQTTPQTGQFTTTDKLPAGAKVVLQSVDRFAS